MSESEYERLSRESENIRKGYYNPDNNNNNQSEDDFEPKFTPTGIMGIVFIVVGVIGVIGILLSFDWSTYNDLKDNKSTHDNVFILMQQEMITTFIRAGWTLMVGVAIGSVLLALDTIIKLLKKNN